MVPFPEPFSGMTLKRIVCIVIGLAVLSVSAQNPISPPGVYIADPTARIDNDGRMYIYGSLDESTSHYCSRSYHILSSNDLRHCTLHRNTFTWHDIIYAPDMMWRDNTYYLYFDDPKGNEFVAEGSSPTGPFTNATRISGPRQIDPNIFIDDDIKAQDSLLACAGEEFFSNPRVGREIAIRKQTPGQPFTDFEMTDKEGNKHCLSEYIGSGRYVLVDIWASWCLGCRLEIPHIQAAYDKYKDKGFDAVLVSIDTTQKPWLNAIEKDKSGSLGHHLLDVKSSSMKAYGLSYIPFNILVDPQGKIVAKELKNDKLDNLLKELLLK